MTLFNPNSTRKRYLLWTNAAIPASAGTRFLYPMTRTRASGSSQGSPWPVADGIDRSQYRNHRRAVGLLALDLADDYIGSYDAEKDRGLVRHANRFVARGAGIWTWGAGEPGRQHVSTYTDADGPYVELRSGRFAGRRQYEFLEPGTADGWTEYWYPVRGIGGFVTANLNGALNVVEKPGAVMVGIFPTRVWKQAAVRLLHRGREVARALADLSPKKPWRRDSCSASWQARLPWWMRSRSRMPRAPRCCVGRRLSRKSWPSTSCRETSAHLSRFRPMRRIVRASPK